MVGECHAEKAVSESVCGGNVCYVSVLWTGVLKRNVALSVPVVKRPLRSLTLRAANPSSVMS